jgi:hypothetical protein
MTRKAGIKPALATVQPGSPELLELTGPRAAYVEPSAQPAPQPAGRSRGGAPRSRQGGSSSPRQQRTDKPAHKQGQKPQGQGSSQGGGRSRGPRAAAASAGPRRSISEFSAGAGRRSR